MNFTFNVQNMEKTEHCNVMHIFQTIQGMFALSLPSPSSAKIHTLSKTIFLFHINAVNEEICPISVYCS
jgi:hypothetical protein